MFISDFSGIPKSIDTSTGLISTSLDTGSTCFDRSIPIRGFNSEKNPDNSSRHYKAKYGTEVVKQAFREKKLDKLYDIALEMTEEDQKKRITVKEAHIKLRRAMRAVRIQSKPTRPLPQPPITPGQ